MASSDVETLHRLYATHTGSHGERTPHRCRLSGTVSVRPFRAHARSAITRSIRPVPPTPRFVNARARLRCQGRADLVPPRTTTCVVHVASHRVGKLRKDDRFAAATLDLLS